MPLPSGLKPHLMNQLSSETSPYLLQHAQNPVHWKAWNDTTLAQAKASKKLIIVSIGYSACHWCHVMEHETFENDQAAQTMNAHFISIKIDREERPDIDATYMKAIQIMTGRGGWPLNVVALPDGRPVWGGTYFRKEEWIETLEQLQQLYANNPDKMIDYAEKLHAGIQSISVIQPQKSENELRQDLLKPLVEKWKKSFDTEFGGMARAPKFMMPNNYKFLQRYGYENHDSDLLDFVDLTLTKMAYGGLFDIIDGGFSRYSVDMKWHVPHFEKMLYDNGQLVSLYSDAFKRTKIPLYQEVVEKTLTFISKELTTDEGAFYCALDADSLNSDNHLEEGAFYVWTKKELQELIKTEFDLFAQVFNINDFGLWEHQNYVLIQSQSIETLAKAHYLTISELQSKKKNWEQILYAAREKRSKPRLDDKVLTSWNAIMLSGFVDAYKAFQNEDYLKCALKNASFLIKKQWHPDGHLWHNYKNGKSTINGYLEDYALLCEAFIALYEVTFDEKWLFHAKQLADYCFDHFYEEESAFFSFTSKLDQQLIAPHYETEDNVIPASNSVMANNLHKLSIYFENSFYEETVTKMLQHMVPQIDYPSAFSNWLNLFLKDSDKSRELAICGSEAIQNLKSINQQYLPNVIVAGSEKETNLPFLNNRFSEDKNLFYICRNKACELPKETLSEIQADLKP